MDWSRFTPITSPLRLLAPGSVLVLNSGRGRAANQDPDVGDRDASLINENEVCGSEIQRLENSRAFTLRLNIDDIRIHPTVICWETAPG